MSQPWFRFYSEMLADRKIAHLVRVTQQPKALVVGVWATILALANDSPIRGVLLLTEEIPLTLGDLARETGLDVDEMQAFITELERLSMLSYEDGAYCLINWDKRQFASDSSTDRVRRWRERQGRDDSNDASDGTGNVSGQEAETLQKRFGNGPDTEADTEADTEEGAGAPPPDPPPKPERKRQKKPTPEAVRVFRSNTHRYPPKAWYEVVETVVGDDPEDLERWGEVCHEWVGKGWNPMNVSGMLDCYSKGGIQTDNGRDHQGAGAARGAATSATRGAQPPPAVTDDPERGERVRHALRQHRTEQQRARDGPSVPGTGGDV